MYTSRVSRVVENMTRMGLEQILVSDPSSVFYLTGSHIAPGERMLALLVRDDGTTTLYANRLFALTGNVSVPLVEFDDTDDYVGILADALKPGRVGVDKFWASQFTIGLMEKRAELRPVVGSAAVDEARVIKDAEELERMRVASRMNDEVTARTIAALKLGMTEAEVAEFYTRTGRELGSQGNSFPALICFGPNAAEPHHDTDDVTKLKNGDAVIIDVGVRVNDYCADMTRTVFMGEPDDEQKRVYELVRRANAAGRAAVRPGATMRDIDLAARKVIEDAGYGKYFIHRTGHHIGLDVHEKPDVSATCEVVARPGMCFSVEPGIYLPGRFGVRVEDLVAVTEDGCETLNSLDRELKWF